MLQQIEDAVTAWNAAPLHIRAMASAYVSPILAALVAIGKRLEHLEGGKNGA